MNDIQARHAAIDDVQNSAAVMSPVVDEFTKRGHERFKSMTRFTATIDGTSVVMTWDEWMEWQMTRDPIQEDPKIAKDLQASFLQKIQNERRGPGISKRPRPAKP